ncbi:hypothetical protein [Cohnella terricola]|uniref:Uncharacterized protein n=1 Tax=Cohnella terricola TaxID=1289167 RepID=A0A559JXC5_9BACL|nr:hypothetical protein [Cohnella terricola]TVY04538.1 hypothetical protein FPZ45_02890 [Cohnella terricola]
MKSDREPSSIWEKYVEAKQAAFSDSTESEEPLTIEELEAAIAETAASTGIPEIGMPPRSTVHPVKQRQLSKWFYLVLVFLFGSLIAALLWWGQNMEKL